jgi:hypothetical protein
MHNFMPKKPMPKGWKSPLRQPLYRVVVEAKDEKEPVAVTPGLLEDAAREFAATVQAMILKGHEQNWSNPTVVLCHV